MRPATFAELERALSDDPRLCDFTARRAGPGVLEVARASAPDELVELVDAARLDAASLAPLLLAARDRGGRVVVVGGEETLERLEAGDAAREGGDVIDLPLLDRGEVAALRLPLTLPQLVAALRDQLDLQALRRRVNERGRSVERYRYELSELVTIARAISSERDVVKLLGLILEKSRYITDADAGSVYIVERPEGQTAPRLRIVVAQNESRPTDFREFTLPVDESSIVGAAVLSRSIVNVHDLDALDRPAALALAAGGAPRLHHNKAADRKSGYQTRSLLTVPMINQGEEVIGVIQLINKKPGGNLRLVEPSDFDRVVPFGSRDEELCSTLAAQAGISLENALLYDEIRHLFEGFVRASVTAIESRDPTTSGHSQRVATLTTGLAKAVDREERGEYSVVRFSTDDLQQIEYAALLHDFGKVGVREQVLVKAKKLYESQRDVLVARFDYVRKSLEAEHLARRLELAREGRTIARDDEERFRAELQRLDEVIALILAANEPTVLPENSFEQLVEVAGRSYVDPRGEVRPLLTAAEVKALQIRRGSLTPEERDEIESHVVHTFNFLKRIPWGRKLGRIPEIAGSHHEKLDGTGYPRGLAAERIPVESKIMTIADIYDALTAKDRPYKRAIPSPKALDIIADEVKLGKCDPELFRIFVDAKIFTLCDGAGG